MPSAKYYYNPKTLRYERVRLSLTNVASTLIALLCFGAVFFLGLFFLQNKLIVTAAEKKLRDENTALRNHHVVLSTRLAEAKKSLSNLQQKEAELHGKFFDKGPGQKRRTAAQSEKGILIGERSEFNKTFDELISKFNRTIFKAQATNDHYHRYVSVVREDLEQINGFPGAMPLENTEPDMLVSGYGKRINPWHKGKYHHDGIDFAGARGTRVLTTGNGRIIHIKKSDLQAGFGNYIEVDHGYGYVTRYTHLGKILVRAGQKVRQGDPIATIGISGGSIAPHLHYEVIKDGNNIDPMKVLVEGMNSNQFHLLATAAGKPNQSLD